MSREPAWLRALDAWKVVPEVLTARQPLPRHSVVETRMPRCGHRLIHAPGWAPEECPACPELGSQR